MAQKQEEKLVIKVRNLYKSFGSKHVLQGVDIDLHSSESLVIVGGSGTGKSVLLKCILGLMQPDSGSIHINGINISEAHPKEKAKIYSSIGMLFQGGALFDSLPVWENVSFGLLQSTKITRAEAREVALKHLKDVGLNEKVLDLSPSELSGGMQKRVALARAVAIQPKIIFFDEPTTGLDPIMCRVIDTLIVDSVKKVGASALSITHDMGSVRRIADRVALLYDGKIVWNDDVKELDRTSNKYVRQFVEGNIDGPMIVDSRAS